MKPFDLDFSTDHIRHTKTLGCYSVSSPRVNGKLKLRYNEHSYLLDERYLPQVYVNGGGGYGYVENDAFRYLDSYLNYNTWEADLKLDVDNQIIDFYNKIGDKATNVLDLIRTRMESYNMVLGNLSKIAKAARALRKGKWKRAANHLGVTQPGQPVSANVPQRWLELQYGWLPLLGDIYSLGTNMFRDPTLNVRLTRFYNDSTNIKGKSGYSTITGRFDQRCRVTMSTDLRIRSDAITTLDNLGVLNPTMVMWEAVPWSFVLDWALPVGDWLASLTALKGVDLFNTGTTYKYDLECTSGTAIRIPSPFGALVGSATSWRKKSFKNRVAGLPARPLPSFKNPFSLSRIANAFSLLATAFGRRT